MLESPSLNVTLHMSSCSHTRIPGLITVIFEVSGHRNPLSVSGVTVTV